MQSDKFHDLQKPSSNSDMAELLQQHLANPSDERYFHRLVGQLQGLIYHSAMRRSGDPDIAEDVAQKVFVLMARKAAPLSRHPTLLSWVFKISSST